MKRVHCEIFEVELEGARGPVAGLEAYCTRCEHRTEAFGTGEGSVARCLVQMRETCPQAEANFYTDKAEQLPSDRVFGPVAVNPVERALGIHRRLPLLLHRRLDFWDKVRMGLDAIYGPQRQERTP